MSARKANNRPNSPSEKDAISSRLGGYWGQAGTGERFYDPDEINDCLISRISGYDEGGWNDYARRKFRGWINSKYTPYEVYKVMEEGFDPDTDPWTIYLNQEWEQYGLAEVGKDFLTEYGNLYWVPLDGKSKSPKARKPARKGVRR